MENWRERAACKDMDSDLWFPVTVRPKTAEDLRRFRIAKETCASCPVRTECLVYAYESGQRYGIWGGMSEHERRTKKGRAIGRALAPV